MLHLRVAPTLAGSEFGWRWRDENHPHPYSSTSQIPPEGRSPAFCLVDDFDERVTLAVSPVPPSNHGRAEKFIAKTCRRAPILFISSLCKAAYNYFNFFGPWTADVQGPRLNLSSMKVKTTSIGGRPPVLLPVPGAARLFSSAPASGPGHAPAKKLQVSRTFPKKHPPGPTVSLNQFIMNELTK